MANKIGEHYDGVISSIIDAGVFVRLENTVEGFVPFRSLRDHYFFDDRSYRAIGAHGGKILSIGMPVTIVVEKVDTEENKIDFSFEYGFEEERNERGGGRPPVKKGRKGKPSASKVRKGASKSRAQAPVRKPSGTGGFAGKPRKGRTGRGPARGRR